MKFILRQRVHIGIHVAPLAGAWIEMLTGGGQRLLPDVAPLAGAWIEIKCALWLESLQDGRPPRGGVD